MRLTGNGPSIRAVRADSGLVPLVSEAIRNGETVATTFFTAPPLKPFSISICPDRPSLTDHWRAPWQFPSFQPECWLIAAAWATELDLLSPRVWSREACGHDAGNLTHIRNVLAHELSTSFTGSWGNTATPSPARSCATSITGTAAPHSGTCSRPAPPPRSSRGSASAREELATGWRTDLLAALEYSVSREHDPRLP